MDGILNLDLVRSAIERPYGGYYRRIELKAAALVQSLAGNHGFADGNKRTTVILVSTLLERSGFDLQPATAQESINDAVEEMVLNTVKRTMTFDDIAAWFKARIRRC